MQLRMAYVQGGRVNSDSIHALVVIGRGGEVVSGYPPQHQPSSFFLLISSLLPSPPPQSSSLHQLLSFPQAGNESCCLWCEGELGGGNNGAERKCQSQRTRVRACFCVFSVYVCVCLPSHGLLKIDVHAEPLWTPAEELSSVALFSCPPTPPLSAFVFHFCL